MANIDIYNNYADKMLETSLEYGKFDWFISGIPPYGTNFQTKEFSASYVIGAIYRKYEKEKNDDFINLFQETLSDRICNNDILKVELNLLCVVDTQLVYQKQGVSPFNIDCVRLLKEAEQNIRKNHRKYKRDALWDKLELKSQNIENNSGHKIL